MGEVKEKEVEEEPPNPDNSPWGLSSSIDLYECNPELIRDAEKIKEFARELVELIEMKAYGETIVVNFGEDERVAGFSMMQLIETSLISAHFANQSNTVYLDVFSCKKFDPQVAADFAKKFFRAKRVVVRSLVRI